MIVVVGRFTHTVYGPFGTERAAQRFIKVELQSSSRYYDTAKVVPVGSFAAGPDDGKGGANFVGTVSVERAV